MFNVSKILVAGATLAFLVGCSDSDDNVGAVLEKDSVTFTNLDQHVVTYKNAAGGATHKDVYCIRPMLGDKNGKDGTWSVAGLELTVMPVSGTSYTYQTTNSELEKDKSYPTTTGETFQVTKIEETVCL